MSDEFKKMNQKSLIGIGVLVVAMAIFQVILLIQIGMENWWNTIFSGKEVLLLAIASSVIVGLVNGRYFKPSTWERLLFLPIYLMGAYICTKLLFAAVGITSRWLVYTLIVLIVGISDATSMIVRSLKK